ncbi:MAG TPA: hypothetical protein VFW07_23340 [Parafilimonas sp.]|nr:hypothetical protein [Parafilimonas sp.]
MANSNQYGSKELFKYVQVEPLRVIDINLKARKFHDEEIKSLLDEGNDEIKRFKAKKIIESEVAIKDVSNLRYNYFEHLTIKNLPQNYLPTRELIKSAEAFKSALNSKDYKSSYKEDYKNTLKSLLAYKILEDEEDVHETTKILNFLEIFPHLDEIDNEEEIRYAPAILTRTNFLPLKQKVIEEPESLKDEKEPEDLKKIANNILTLWKFKNKMLQTKKNEYEKKYKEIIAQKYEPTHDSSIKVSEKGDNKKKTDAQKKEYEKFSNEKKQKLSQLTNDYNMHKEESTFYDMLHIDAKELSRNARGNSANRILQIQNETKDWMTKNDIQPDDFSDAMEKILEEKDKKNNKSGVVLTTRSDSGAVPYSRIKNCFTEYPTFDIQQRDSIRPLGVAKLVKVNEALRKYVHSEISYIENLLAGETKKRVVKSTKYFEQVSESTSEEITQGTQDKSSSSKQELSSQIDSELNTRFNSDINSSVTGSAGGSGGGNVLGFVDLQGSGSAVATVNANLGTDVSTGLRTSDKSNFSQEIVDRAIEMTKKTVAERRLSRSYSLFETTDLHKLQNQDTNGKSINGVYCFLDKQVCITETVYDKRLFLMANVMVPGKNLICEKLYKIKLALSDIGAKPIFDISPDDVTTENYKELAGRFKAANIQPPPAPVINIARTYKTDSSNLSTEQKEFTGKKIAEIIAPFFEQYKRYLITENIKLPDGYEVMEVNVTVLHGKNGISIPPYMPLVAGGTVLVGSILAMLGPAVITGLLGATATAAAGVLATVGTGTGAALAASAAMPMIGAGAAILGGGGVAIWQLLYMISPLLYYNIDSSNVTVCVGNQTDEKRYYFFDPDFLVQQVFDLFGNLTSAMPSILDQIKASAGYLFITDENDPNYDQSLLYRASQVPTEFGKVVQATVSSAVTNINNAIQNIGVSVDFENWTASINHPGDSTWTAADLGPLTTAMENLFSPIGDFIKNVIQIFENAIQNSLSNLLSFLFEQFENVHQMQFGQPRGLKGELPVSINAISIHPGVTLNLTADLVRTDECLDKWKLETFNRLYQSYQQLLAEYESKAFISGNPNAITTSPGILRQEENLAMKERVLYLLNNHDNGGEENEYTIDKLNFFENAIDWNNMSYKLYNYGPNIHDIKLEKKGVFSGVDDRRRAFMKALWAQVLVPIQPIPREEDQILQYFTDGTFDFEGALDTQKKKDDLTALYQNLIQGREISKKKPKTKMIRTDTIPTDLIYLYDDTNMPKERETLCRTDANAPFIE